jgi:hypothetical protein
MVRNISKVSYLLFTLNFHISACVVRVVDKKWLVFNSLSFSMSRKCHGQKRKFQHDWNDFWSQMLLLACLECAVFTNVSFIMADMCCGQNVQFHHV